MIDKITLYKEVLELEPGSRVFFPLAKLLAEKEPAESINILKKGLSRHPDHIEARIFLIELLSVNDGDADLDNELEIVSSILRNYPSFWNIWGAHLAQNSEFQDAALAINFFGAGLSGNPITWTDVMAHGLNALLAEAGGASRPSLPSSPERADSPTVLSADLSASEDGGSDFAGVPDEAVTPLVVQEPVSEVSDDEDGEEMFSLRTRTMADLLAEQGDYDGAIDIYTELLSAASVASEASGASGASEASGASGAGRSALEERLQELEELRRQSAVPGTPKKDSVADAEGDGDKLVSLLESLASRFENRARQ